MKVLIPSALQSYTGQIWVEADGATLAAVLADLDRRYPGMRFRMIDEQDHIRPHVRFFYRREKIQPPVHEVVHELARPLSPDGELLIVQALSGG